VAPPRRRRWRLVVLVVLALVVVVGGLTALVAIPAVHDLQAAGSALEGSASDLEPADVERAQAYLDDVESRLSGIPARVLGIVPVIGPSLNAMRSVAAAAKPVLGAGLTLKQDLDLVRDRGLLENGRILGFRVEELRPSVERERAALDDLHRTVVEHRNGWVAPPVWDALDEIASRIDSLRRDAGDFDSLINSIDALLGGDEPRTYLVMLVNNAELRGGGGVLSGLGTIELDNGHMRLGRFYPYELLVRHPFEPVPAPTDYERRYAHFGANTTVFVNATYSPDVPDDAIVASRLFARVEGTKTDGAFVVDPRGLAALMPPDARIPVPGKRIELAADDLPSFIYSDAYNVFDDNTERRAAILDVGARAFRTVIEGGTSDKAATDAAGAAFAAGHLRFVSFDDDEQATLAALGVSGELTQSSSDSLLVAVQNFGGGGGLGSKLDYWADRSVEHRCTVEGNGAAECSSETTLANGVPTGLTRYVAGRPYGLLRSYVETYVPANAQIDSVTVDGAETDFYPQEEEGRTSVAVSVKVPPGERRSIRVLYRLPPNDGYSFVASPQPLARDATLTVSLAFPADWSIAGPGDVDDGVLGYSGDFVADFEVHAEPDQRTGIPGVWDSLTDFWREPVL
jgi:uncharacterized protein DUF4012